MKLETVNSDGIYFRSCPKDMDMDYLAIIAKLLPASLWYTKVCFCSLERICQSELIDPAELIELIEPIEPIKLIELTWILYSEKSTGQVCGKKSLPLKRKSSV